MLMSCPNADPGHIHSITIMGLCCDLEDLILIAAWASCAACGMNMPDGCWDWMPGCETSQWIRKTHHHEISDEMHCTWDQNSIEQSLVGHYDVVWDKTRPKRFQQIKHSLFYQIAKCRCDTWEGTSVYLSLEFGFVATGPCWLAYRDKADIRC